EDRHVFNLHNAYGEYCAAPKKNRPQVLQHFVRTWFSYLKEAPAEFADARPDLLPGVRSRSYCEFARFQLQAQGSTNRDCPRKDWPHRVLAEHLAISLIYDFPESMIQVMQADLSDWGVTFEEALDAALDNLREISQQRFTMPRPGVWASNYRDN